MSSRSFNIFCSQCNEFILRYQKQGSGSLIRIYIKNILEPEQFKKFKNLKLKSEIPRLDCPRCLQRVGINIIHKSGGFPAYRMIKGSFFKKES